MDLSLPILDGWEATRRLKADVRTAHIPVVALTAHDGSGELQRATRAGCDWFVPKPCHRRAHHGNPPGSRPRVTTKGASRQFTLLRGLRVRRRALRGDPSQL